MVAVEALARQLTDAGVEVFLDVWSLPPGMAWSGRLEDRIATSDAIVVVLGPHGMGGWQQRECYLAIDRQTKQPDFPVIPVLIPGHDNPALGFLSLNTWIDLRVHPVEGVARLIAAVRGETLPVAPSDPRDDICPYRGLEPFREEDAPFFFGRETFAARLHQRMTGHPFVVVVGASGSGKSSIVHAGLAPALRAAEGPVWDIVSFRPGADPVTALIRALDPPPPELGLSEAFQRTAAIRSAVLAGEIAIPGLVAERLARSEGAARLLLIVDQFEEIRTLCHDPAARDWFTGALLDLAVPGGAVSVVATLRSDFYGLMSEDRALLERVEGAVFTVGPLSRHAEDGRASELVRAIRNPAEAVGLSFEDGLTERIVADLGNAPGDLTLLEFLLTELWRARSLGRLTHAAYDNLGGVTHALAGRAESAFQGLTDDEKAAARRVFLSLVRPGADATDTRVRAARPTHPLEARVVDLFAGRHVRLLVTGEDPETGRWVDIVHEALIRNWDRLKHWIDDARDALRSLDRVRTRALRWEDEGRTDDLLLPRGLELEEGRRLLAGGEDLLLGKVEDYIRQSIARDEARIAAEAAQEAEIRARDLSAQRRLRNVFVAAFALTAILLAVAVGQWRTAVDLQGVAEAERSEAETARDLADRNRRAAETAEASAEAARDRAEAEADLAVARGLAAEAAQVMDAHSGEMSVAAMLAADSLARRPTDTGRAVLREILALAAPDATVLPTPWAGGHIAVSGDGQRVGVFATTDTDAGPVTSELIELDADFATVRRSEIAGGPDPLFSPDGRWLVAGGETWRLLVHDRQSGAVALDHPTRGVVRAVFSPDGGMLYGVDEAGTIHRIRTSDWSVLPPFSVPAHLSIRRWSMGADISPDGETLLVSLTTVSVWAVDLTTGETRRLPVAPDDNPDILTARYPTGARITPDGEHHLVWDNRGGMTLFDAATGQTIWTADDGWEGRNWRGAVAFEAGGRVMASGGWGGRLTTRDLASGDVIARHDHGGGIVGVAILPDGRLVSAGEGGARIWSPDGGAIPCGPETDVAVLAVDKAGPILATGDGRLIRCDPATGQIVAERRFDAPVRALAQGPDGAFAVTLTEGDNRANWSEMAVIDRTTDSEVARILWNGGLTAFALNHDGSRIAATFWPDRLVRIWNVATGAVETEIPDARTVAFSPDGETLRIDGRGQRIVDTVTGETRAELGQPMGVWELLGPAHADRVVTRGDGRDTQSAIRVWDLAANRLLWDSVDSAVVAPGGAVAAAQKDGAETVTIHDTATGQLLSTYEVPAGAILSHLTDDGRRGLVSVRAPDGGWTFALRDLATGQELATRELPFGPYAATALPGGRFTLAFATIGDAPSASVELLDQDGSSLLTRQYDALIPPDVWADDGGTRLFIQSAASSELVDVATGKTLWTVPSFGFRTAIVHPEMDLIAGLDNNAARIVLLDPATGVVRSEIPLDEWGYDLAVTSDGARLLVSVSSDTWSGIRTFDVATGAPGPSIERGTEPRALHPLSDPRRVLVADGASAAYVLDLATGQRDFDLYHSVRSEKHAYATRAARAVTASGSTLTLWDSASGDNLARREVPGGIKALALGPEGRLVYYLLAREGDTGGEADYEVLEIWNTDTDRIRTVAVDTARDLVLSPSGLHVAVADRGGSVIRVFDAARLVTVLDVLPLRRGQFFGSPPMTFSGDGRFLSVVEDARYGEQQRRSGLRVFDLTTGSEIVRTDIAYPSQVHAAGAHDLLYQGVDRRMRALRLPPPGLDTTLGRGARSLVTVPGTSQVVAHAIHSGAQLLDLATGEVRDLVPDAAEMHLRAVAAHPDGRYLALSLYDTRTDHDAGRIEVHDLDTGDIVAVNADPGTAIWTLAFLPGDGDLFLAQESGTLLADPRQTAPALIWNWRSGMTTPVGDGTIGAMSMAADGQTFALKEGVYDSDTNTEHAPRRIDFYTTEGPTRFASRPFDSHSPRVVLSDDGRRAAIFGLSEPTRGEVIEIADDGAIDVLLDVPLAARVNTARPVAFLDGGRRFVLGEQGGARVYDLDTGDMVRLSEQELVRRWAVSDDKRLLAVAGEDFVAVWSLETHERLFGMAEPGVADIGFAGPDGDRLAVLTDRGLVLPVWQEDELIARACAAFARDLWQPGRARSALADGTPVCTPDLVGK